ncbi:hypothetical protein [Piscinibacter sp.]|uniref:hypothetical protein n=1 Tax=Piscinibacter sp. TaxID=1903157 RepID=UPI0039E4A675
MSHVHVHMHDHEHDHGHAAPAPEGPSVLMRGAAARVLAALGAIVLLWAAVAWALADLSSRSS